jgi:hypothetical protein
MDRLRSSLNGARSITSNGFVAETPLPGLAADGAVLGPVRHTIETPNIDARAPSQPGWIDSGQIGEQSVSSDAELDQAINDFRAASESDDSGSDLHTPSSTISEVREERDGLRRVLETVTNRLNDVLGLTDRLRTRAAVHRGEAQHANAELDRMRAEVIEARRQAQQHSSKNHLLSGGYWIYVAVMVLLLVLVGLFVRWANGIELGYVEKQRKNFFGME